MYVHLGRIVKHVLLTMMEYNIIEIYNQEFVCHYVLSARIRILLTNNAHYVTHIVNNVLGQIIINVVAV